MRAITVKRDQFNDFLFPAIARSAAKDEQELEVAVRVLKKVKDPDKTYEEDIPKPQLEMAQSSGQKIYPFRKLAPPDHKFIFEEDEHKLIVDRLREFLKTVSLIAAEEFLDFFKTVRDAPEHRQMDA